MVFTARSLDVVIDGRCLVRGATFELASGELTALTGPSGSGKSSLLRALAGLSGDAAELEVDGLSIGALGMPVWRRRVNYLPQTPSLLPQSVAANLALPFRYQSRAADPEGELNQGLAKAQLASLGLPSQVWEQDASLLSVGEQQRVCLVRALSLKPKVLLMDEPTAALDGASTARVERLIRQWVKSTGASALVVTHDEAQVSRWASRRYRLKNARRELAAADRTADA